MLGENLRRARKIRGLSQAELAAELNVVRQTVSKWEKGLSTPDCKVLVKISEVLGLPLSALLGDDEFGKETEQGMAARLERLQNAIDQERACRQRQQRGLSVVLLLCGGAILGWSTMRPLFLWSVQHRLAAAAAEGTMIGGADAATSLYTAASSGGMGTVGLGGILVFAALWIMARNRRKAGK